MYEPKLRKRRSGLPIISHAEIDSHVEGYLKDYKPSLLMVPQPIDIEEFAEYYLNLSLDYVYLSHCGLILGRMIFQNNELVPVYLPAEKCASYMCVGRGTLLLDNTLLDDYKEYRFRSTIGHECGHWVFHSKYFTYADQHIKQGIIQAENIIGCKKSDIEGNMENTPKKKLITDIDWLEHQAKYFSASILMPRTPFFKAATELMDCENLNEVELANALSEIFQVSPASVNIRLSQLGITEDIRDRTERKEHFSVKALFE